MTVITTIVGNVGKDASHKSTQGGKEFISFPVAAKVGWGDREQTLWFDVTKWAASQKQAALFLKGTKVTVIGRLSTREHEGKTYLQIDAQEIVPQGRAGGDATPQGDGWVQPMGNERSVGGVASSRAASHPAGSQSYAQDADLDDVPF
jgi:single-strand DNA-binding protein